tara:strand:- start:69 stop:539 length:471 start_codon:yes stop_codon:yes gene_type:complete
MIVIVVTSLIIMALVVVLMYNNLMDDYSNQLGEKIIVGTFSLIFGGVLGACLSFSLLTFIWCNFSETRDVYETEEVGQVFLSDGDYIYYQDLGCETKRTEIYECFILGSRESEGNIIVRRYSELVDTAFWETNMFHSIESSVLTLGKGEIIKDLKE